MTTSAPRFLKLSISPSLSHFRWDERRTTQMSSMFLQPGGSVAGSASESLCDSSIDHKSGRPTAMPLPPTMIIANSLSRSIRTAEL